MTRILFIVPPNLPFDKYVNPADNTRHVPKADGRMYGNLATDMPLGIMSMSAYLKENTEALTIQLIDFNIELNALDRFDAASFDEYFSATLAERYADFQPDIVGISSLFTPSYHNLLALGRSARACFPDALVIAGGSVPSSMYRQIFRQCPDFDALCYGEGEKPLLDLVRATDRRAYIAASPSWITIDKILRGEQFAHDFIDNLDELPFYDYELCEFERYGLNPALTAYAAIEDKTNNFHVMTSRGCPFKCTFCASHQVHGRKMRYYSLERVRADFERLRDQYGARTLVVQDDHFMGDKERARAIVDMIGEMGMTAVFQNGLALYALERPMLEAMHRAGVYHLMLSIESGSARVLKDIMKKPLKVSIAKRVAADCRELGIYTNANILIGLPGETKQDIEDTRQFLRTVDANWFIIFAAAPLVGSEMHEICESKGYLTEGYIGQDYKSAVVETEDFSAEYIQEQIYLLNLELNFVHNADMRLGDYSSALKGLLNAIRAKSDHAFAYYYAARCFTQLGDHDRAAQYHARAVEFFAASTFWQRYRDHFGLVVEPAVALAA
ncbi:radical SAM protein [Zoogloea sp. 1C4]|uniref:B12-binding domain-containing radical SAM protein n=1 Tax=Zoogloea sp. 1C4 TaxID=2570190 RepID=UPI001290F679|nr:radical SAM protein [Zoogloea sp. 1C4]